MIEIAQISVDSEKQNAALIAKGDLCRTAPDLFIRCFDPIKTPTHERCQTGIAIENMGEASKYLFLVQEYDTAKDETKFELSLNLPVQKNACFVADVTAILNQAVQNIADLVMYHYDGQTPAEFAGPIEPAQAPENDETIEPIIKVAKFVADGCTEQVTVLIRGDFHNRSAELIDACFLPIRKKHTKPKKYAHAADFGEIAAFIVAMPLVYDAAKNETRISFILGSNYEEVGCYQKLTSGETMELLNRVAQATLIAMEEHCQTH